MYAPLHVGQEARQRMESDGIRACFNHGDGGAHLVQVEHEEKRENPEETIKYMPLEPEEEIENHSPSCRPAGDGPRRGTTHRCQNTDTWRCARGVQYYVAAGPVIHKYLMSNKQHGGIT